jgi:hypothetical protein
VYSYFENNLDSSRDARADLAQAFELLSREIERAQILSRELRAILGAGSSTDEAWPDEADPPNALVAYFKRTYRETRR